MDRKDFHSWVVLRELVFDQMDPGPDTADLQYASFILKSDTTPRPRGWGQVFTLDISLLILYFS